MEDIAVRPYRKEERDSIRDIAWNTAFFGRPANVFFADEEIFTNFLTEYFTDHEPESCFVARTNSRVIGYLLGAKNTATLNRVVQTKILPRLLIKAAITGTFLKRKNILFFQRLLFSFLRREFKMPDFSCDYPATLHINLEEGWRNLKIGSRLIAAYLNYLAQEGIPGVYLATMSEGAKGFFENQGFSLLHKGRRSYFRHILHKDIPIYIYGKKIP
jgi:ribosomal protein S18 acetylase RimI-like enzyme